MMLPRRTATLCASLLLCGCGNPGSPLPPSLMLPAPVTDLGAARTGDSVALHWTMPRRTTDRIKLVRDQRAAICRALQQQPCLQVALLLLSPGQPAAYTDVLPADLVHGQFRLLRYEVDLQNRRKRSAGASNPAFSAAGSAPPAVTAVAVHTSAAGITVQWQAPVLIGPNAPGPSSRLLARLQRDTLPSAVATPNGSAPRQNPSAGIPQTPQQTLESPLPAPASGRAWGAGLALDPQPVLNRSYRYTVQLAEQLSLDGHAIEIDGPPARSAIIAATDVFPPAVPAELAAVPNAEAGTIDLSWTAGADADLAGYIIYRRAPGAGSAPRRVSGAAPIAIPAWSDQDVHRGQRYAYSVSAVDTSGNESARSAEVQASLP